MIQDELRRRSTEALKAGDKEARLALSSILGRFGEVEKRIEDRHFNAPPRG